MKNTQLSIVSDDGHMCPSSISDGHNVHHQMLVKLLEEPFIVRIYTLGLSGSNWDINP